MNLESQIEAILFFLGEPVEIRKLALFTGAKEEDVKVAIDQLSKNLINRGISVVKDNNSAMLGTSKEVSALIEKITKDELTKELGKAGLETLSIILYRSPVTKREIDDIRGVNSAFIIRNLMIRGLVSREETKGKRGFAYAPTLDVLSFLGVGSVNELPEYESIVRELSEFERNNEEEINNNGGERSEV